MKEKDGIVEGGRANGGMMVACHTTMQCVN